MSQETPAVDLTHQAGDWDGLSSIDGLVSSAVSITVTTANLQIPDGAELSIVLSDNQYVQELNNLWRSIDKPTNVLSFPTREILPGEVPDVLLGDIIIAHETVEQEAMQLGKPFNDHFIHLVVHGLLHIFGYDHINDKDAEIMENVERQCLAAMGLPDPYGEQG